MICGDLAELDGCHLCEICRGTEEDDFMRRALDPDAEPDAPVDRGDLVRVTRG
ncbi:MAG TPA: hypothetical protein VMW80_11415 [Candidatus Dormibacteraeota bacterium]|nr:hypothetical protein [Candidatus Dormibacteraeota bacterium]